LALPLALLIRPAHAVLNHTREALDAVAVRLLKPAAEEAAGGV
jgi:hypothetical protein